MNSTRVDDAWYDRGTVFVPLFDQRVDAEYDRGTLPLFGDRGTVPLFGQRVDDAWYDRGTVFVPLFDRRVDDAEYDRCTLTSFWR